MKKITWLFIICGIITVAFLTVHYSWNASTEELEEVTFHIFNGKNNGTLATDIEYNLDFSKKINFDRQFSDNIDTRNSPFYIEITVYSNVSFDIHGLSSSYIYLDTLSTSFETTNYANLTAVGNYFELTWFKNHFIVNNFKMRIYLSNIISKIELDRFSINLETWIETEHTAQVNQSSNVYQQFNLENFQEKKIRIENSDMDFILWSEDLKISNEFEHQNEYYSNDGKTTHDITNFGLDFSTQSSRTSLTINNTFFDLGLTFGVTTILSTIISNVMASSESAEDKMVVEELKKSREENKKILEELVEIKQQLTETNSNNE